MVIDRIKQYFLGARRPREIVVEVTHRCNLDCEFCFNKAYIQDRGSVRELSTGQVKVVIDRVAASSASVIRFTGGEPLLREDIAELMRYARQQGLQVWLNTNATLIQRAEAKVIAKYVQNVLIPLNAYDRVSELRASHDDILKRKLKGIKCLLQAQVPFVRCGTVANKENIFNLYKIFALVKRLGVSNWEVFREMPLPGKAYNITPQDIAVLVNKLIEINARENKRYFIANAIPFCVYDPEKVSRVALGAVSDDGHSRFVIDPLGKAKPMYYLNEAIGDIFTTDIESIWQAKFMQDMRNLKFVPAACKKCFYLRKCRGGSRFAAKTVYGDYAQADPLSQPQSS